MNYKEKYLKYKIKYLKLNQIKHKKIKGGNLSPEIIRLIGLGSVGLFTILGILYKIFSKTKDEIETTDLDELKLNQLVNQTESDSIDELKKEIFESTNQQELKVLEDKYFDIKNQLKDTEEKRKTELEKQKESNLKERKIYQHNNTGLLLKNNSLDEERYKELLYNIKILEEKYIILFDKERERREKLIINDYSKKLEELEVDYSKKLEELELEWEKKDISLDNTQKANIKSDLKQQLYGNLETEYKNKMKYLNDDMNNIDKKLKLYAVNFYLDYCEKKYLTGKLCDKQDTQEIEEIIIKEYNNNFIKDIESINQQIIETRIEIERIFEKNKNENETKIKNTIEHIEDTEIRTIKDDLEEELVQKYLKLYEDEIQRIESDIPQNQVKSESDYDVESESDYDVEPESDYDDEPESDYDVEPESDYDDEDEDEDEKEETLPEKKQTLSEIKQTLKEKEDRLKELYLIEKIQTLSEKKQNLEEKEARLKDQKNNLKELEASSHKRLIRTVFKRNEEQDENYKTYLLKLDEIKKLDTSIGLLKEEINILTKEIEQLKQGDVLFLPKIDTFKQDIEDYSKLLIKKFLTTEERRFYKKENPELEKKIADWIKTTDVYNKYKDRLPEKEAKIDDSNNPDRTMSLGGKKNYS